MALAKGTQDYLKSLIDPFNTGISNLKLRDGKTQRSAGVRFRSTGEIKCDHAETTVIVLFPGHSNGLCWRTNATFGTNTGTAGIYTNSLFNNHVNTTTDRTNIKQLRIVSSGLKLNLVNNEEQNDGYWEAARIPIDPVEFTCDATTGRCIPTFLTGSGFDIDLSNHTTYQSGRNKDLHKYLFKNNYHTVDHPFSYVTASTPEIMIDQAFDMVVIKIRGRSDSVNQTKLMFELVSNQEIVYNENTALARLMSPSPAMQNHETFFQNTNFALPSVLVA
jgi:ribosomal protein L35